MFIKTLFSISKFDFENYYLVLSHNQMLRFNRKNFDFYLYENKQFIFEKGWEIRTQFLIEI